MTSLWASMSNSDSDSDSDSDFMERMPAPPGVDLPWAQCVHVLKWKLYEAIVLGPELSQPEAQQNELLQVYVNQLEQLYRILEKATHGAVPTSADLRPFPSRLRLEIMKCASGLKGRMAGAAQTPKHVADRIPYQDFLKQTLRTYPFTHRGAGGNNEEA